MDKPLEIIHEKPASSPRPTPLLFVHGMCHAAWCWQENFLPYFAKHHYESFALNLQGHGKSESNKPLRSISVADYVSDISRAVNQIGAPPVLIGHSMGGMVIQKYLETHQAPAAVLVASVPPTSLLASTIRFAFRRPWAFMRVNLKRSMYPLIETPYHCKRLLFSQNIPDEQAEKYCSLMQDESHRAFLDMVALNLVRPKRVKTPVLVLGAANDRLVSRHEYEVTARAYNTKAEIFPDMGHDMMLDIGWQQVADRILRWLKDRKL